MEQLELISELQNKIEFLSLIIQVAGKYARENLPADLPKDSRYLDALIGGKKDINGEKFILAWIDIAKQKLK